MTAALHALTGGRSAHYLTGMVLGSFSKIFVGRRLLAIAMAIAVLFAGLDLHHGSTPSLHGAGDAGVVVTMDKKASPDSEKASVVDHACHGCVVFAAIDSNAGIPSLVTSIPSIGDTADLVGAISDFPARPPRTEIQLF